MRSAPGYAQLLGIELDLITLERIEGHLIAGAEHSNGTGKRLHGGLIMSLADHTGAMVAIANLPEGHGTATIESKTNFFAAGEVGRLNAVAIPLHVGRSTIVIQTTVSNADGRRVAMVTQTQIVIPLKSTGGSTASMA
jgi:1,4-dihydroxy-2-naphthoyl-CoA hydrolase